MGFITFPYSHYYYSFIVILPKKNPLFNNCIHILDFICFKINFAKKYDIKRYLFIKIYNSRNKFFISKNYFKINKYNIMKKVLLNKISKETIKNISNIKVLFLSAKGRFGNYFISINNAIIYCEFLKCQKIIVEYNNDIFINNTIFYKKYNLTIEPNQTINFLDKNVLIVHHGFFFLIILNTQEMSLNLIF